MWTFATCTSRPRRDQKPSGGESVEAARSLAWSRVCSSPGSSGTPAGLSAWWPVPDHLLSALRRSTHAAMLVVKIGNHIHELPVSSFTSPVILTLWTLGLPATSPESSPATSAQSGFVFSPVRCRGDTSLAVLVPDGCLALLYPTQPPFTVGPWGPADSVPLCWFPQGLVSSQMWNRLQVASYPRAG